MGTGLWKTVEKVSTIQRVKVQAVPGKDQGYRSDLAPEVGPRLCSSRPAPFLAVNPVWPQQVLPVSAASCSMPTSHTVNKDLQAVKLTFGLKSCARAQPASVSCETVQLWAEMATVLPTQADGETGASCVNVTRVSIMKVMRHRVA